METKMCIVEGCSAHAMSTRRYCREHYLEKKRKQAKAGLSSGKWTKTKYNCTCIWCGRSFMSLKPTTMVCSKACDKAMRTAIRSLSEYKLSKSSGGMAYLHRYLAAQAIGEDALKGKELHHKDLDKSNNALSNLLILSKDIHTKLHRFITFGALKRTSYEDPKRIDHMYELIPELTEAFFEGLDLSPDTVQDMVDKADLKT